VSTQHNFKIPKKKKEKKKKKKKKKRKRKKKFKYSKIQIRFTNSMIAGLRMSDVGGPTGVHCEIRLSEKNEKEKEGEEMKKKRKKENFNSNGHFFSLSFFSLSS